MSKPKYLVVIGCSLSFGQEVEYDETWGYQLAKELGLQLINLASGGSGFYYIEDVLNQFIIKNKQNLKDYFFIIQNSELNRCIDYQNISFIPHNNQELKKHGIKVLSKVSSLMLGGDKINRDCSPRDKTEVKFWQTYEEDFNFPNHRVNPNHRNPWYIKDGENEIYPPDIEIQFQNLMNHWSYKNLSIHSLLKGLGVKHLLVDGYFPLLSHKLNFRKYKEYEVNDYDFTQMFWSNESSVDDEDNVMLYDFENIECADYISQISSENKIDDCVLWTLFAFRQPQTDWNIDGGHPGKKGHEIISKVLLKNIQEKKLI